MEIKKTIPGLTDGSAAADTDLLEVARVSGDGYVSRRLTIAMIRAGLALERKTTIASRDPTANDDSTQGYEVLSRFVNDVTMEIFWCLDATAGAAHWENGTLTADDLGTAALMDSTSFLLAAGGNIGWQTSPKVVVSAAAMAVGQNNGVMLSQSIAGPGNAVLNGGMTSAGKWTSPHARVGRTFYLTSSGDDRGINITVTGKDYLGNTVSETKAGANAGAQSFTTYYLTEITQVAFSGATAGTVVGGLLSPRVFIDPTLGNFWDITLGATLCSYCGVMDGMAADTTGGVEIYTTQDATARTITFAGGTGITAKVLGPALDSGLASKVARHVMVFNKTRSTIYNSNAGAEA